MTKEQQLKQESISINNSMDKSAEQKGGYAFTGQIMACIKVEELDKLREDNLNLQLQNSILLNTNKEVLKALIEFRAKYFYENGLVTGHLYKDITEIIKKFEK